MTVRERLIAGTTAAGLGPLITAFIQLVSVPAFMRTWGAHTYGEWLLMSAVPTYLSVADNDMAMRIAAGDRAGAVETFQSTWVLVTSLSLFFAAVVSAILLTVPLAQYLNITSIPPTQVRLVIAFLSIYSLASLQSGMLLSGFRSDGYYALGTASINAMRLVENVATLALLMFRGEPVCVAMAAALIRSAGTVLLYFVLIKKLSWMETGMGRASLRRAKELIRPAVAFTAFPAGNALSIQGMTIVVGCTLGPIAVATFNPMRTLSRSAYQIIDAIKNAVWPELSAAYGARNWPLARKLHRACCQVAFWLACIAVIALSILGPTIFRLWTHGRVAMDVRCFYILLATVIASSLWSTSSAVSIAANLHEHLAILYLAGTAGSLMVALFLMPRFNMAGAATALLAADIWMGCFVIRGSNLLLNDNTSDFMRSMFGFPSLRVLTAR